MLKKVTKMLEKVTKMLEKVTKMLEKVTKMLDKVAKMLEKVAKTSEKVTKMLDKWLKRQSINRLNYVTISQTALRPCRNGTQTVHGRTCRAVRFIPVQIFWYNVDMFFFATLNMPPGKELGNPSKRPWILCRE